MIIAFFIASLIFQLLVATGIVTVIPRAPRRPAAPAPNAAKPVPVAPQPPKNGLSLEEFKELIQLKPQLEDKARQLFGRNSDDLSFEERALVYALVKLPYIRAKAARGEPLTPTERGILQFANEKGIR